MKSGKIKLLDASRECFAAQGFEGASLRRIAELCGIQKPSIYAHFRSKEDLFLKVLARSVQQARRSMKRYYAAHRRQPLELRLKGLLEMLLEQYRHNQDLKFLLRTCYFPPQSLYREVLAAAYPFLDELELRLTAIFRVEMEECPLIGPQQAAAAFMALADGVLVDTLYDYPERSVRRLELAWPVFWRGISGKDGSMNNTHLEQQRSLEE
ncbi:TetR/AcrR family transcriptional regulator [Paenibacillus pinistramenti]|uniref:TetR/AcrR family transcriptional regulator n=1 Tax=Paenibacillus pinistramenti TaxID=1768003 RepID=UPI0011087DAA|nr:TetR/AcrR family transcriptional regulator [Paenibacillus pinistramenti]